MTIPEIILTIIIITLSILLTFLAISTLQLIKELKNSLSKINKLLDKPDSLAAQPLKKFEESLSYPHPVKPNSPPHLFHRQNNN